MGVWVAFAHLNTKQNISVGFPGLAASHWISLVTPPQHTNALHGSGTWRRERGREGEEGQGAIKGSSSHPSFPTAKDQSVRGEKKEKMSLFFSSFWSALLLTATPHESEPKCRYTWNNYVFFQRPQLLFAYLISCFCSAETPKIQLTHLIAIFKRSLPHTRPAPSGETLISFPH